MLFSKRLSDLRTDNDLTQEQLAKKLHTKQSNISLYENGTQPGFEMLEKMCAFFGVTADYLLGFSDIPNPYPDKTVTPQEMNLLARYRNLSEESKIRIDERISITLESEQRKK